MQGNRISTMNWPKEGWGAIFRNPGVASWFEGSLFGVANLGNLWGKILQYQLGVMVFTCTLGSIFMVRALVHSFIVNWRCCKEGCMVISYLVHKQGAFLINDRGDAIGMYELCKDDLNDIPVVLV